MELSSTTTDQTTCTATTDKAVHSLSYHQVQRLSEVVSETLQLYPKTGTGNFPTLPITLSRLVKVVKRRLSDKEIHVRDVRLNGSAASYCIAEERVKEPKLHYNDLDVIFTISLRDDFELQVIKEEVLNSLYEFFPKGTSTDRITRYMLEESYVKKMVKVSNSRTDCWSLIALGDEMGKNIELKFVDSMKRQYEFSVDSFQIILDPLILVDEMREGGTSVRIEPDFFPTISATSLFGEFVEAEFHLNNRLISTKNPAEIRGGGLLKYCFLQVIGYKPADTAEMESYEPYMCSRFFIDFPSANSQMTKIQKYLWAHFIQPGHFSSGAEFLDMLVCVVSKQARCLMESERQKTIGIIQQIYMWHYPFLYNPVPVYSVSSGRRHWHAPHHHNNQRHNGHYHHHRHHSSNGGRRRASSNSSNESDHLHSPTPPPHNPHHLFFPHTANNTVPVGPTPTPVR